MGVKKKYKLKKTKIGIFIILPIVLIALGVGVFFIYQNNQELKDIQNHYFEFALTRKKSYLYNKQHKKVAEIKKEFPLALEKIKITSHNQKYFKLKDLDYYVYYEDLKQGKEIKDNTKEYQIPFNKNVISKKKTILGNKDIIFLQGCNIPLSYETETSYFVSFQNQLLEIQKNESIQTKEVENTKEKASDHISVFYYEEISDNCTHINCTTTEHFKEEINLLKENGYYTITKEDFEKVINHYIRVKEKAIFLTTTLPQENTKALQEELNITLETVDDRENVKYYSTNKTTNSNTTKEFVDRYQLKNFTPLENVLKMAQGEEIKEATDENQRVAVLNYHFFYDASAGEACNESICLDTGVFREELQYLKNNHYKTLSMDEYKRWMYNEIEIPTRSVLITVDDGALGTGKENGNKLIPMIEEFRMNATLFLIAGWWPIENYLSPNLDIQSHTYDMHLYGSCGRGQINCATYEEAKIDLEKSLQIIGNNDSFCFPFYMYSNTSIQAVKDTGFKLAFVGGMRKSSRKDNKYLIPRYPIHSDITMNQFISYVS